tara:strand:- start:187 stop:402 length:216 start_codon:yes stop_codon:yes gene_type:complete
MNDVIKKINEFLGMATDLLLHLVLAGAIIGILFDDQFNVIANIGTAASSIGENGLAGLVTILIVAMWMKKK